MLRTMHHRGPDASGLYIRDQIGIGHARLSVIDIAGGAQPMCSPEHKVVLSFNGTICNFVELRTKLQRHGYSFNTSSDTEVVLKMYLEYGDDCIKEFNGEWALALWDGRSSKLLLTRDRAGTKPLFFTQDAQSFVFASTIKALFSASNRVPAIDLRGLHEAFMFWSPQAPRTLFSNVEEVVAGTVLTVRDSKVNVRRYWQFDFSDVDTELHESDSRQTVSELLHDAVKLRLRADVPVAAYLSGGMDSALVAALAGSMNHARLRTYSIAFVDSSLDESKWQRSIAKHLGTEHHEVLCRDEDLVAAFPETVQHAEQPLLRTAAIPMYLLSKQVRDNKDTVVLSGEGADELFGGYDIFKEAKIQEFIRSAPNSPRRSLLYQRLYSNEPMLRTQPQAFTESFFAKRSSAKHPMYAAHASRWQANASLFSLFSENVKNAFPAASIELLAELDAALPANFQSWSSLARTQYLEAVGFLPGCLLSTQGDRAAMAHSVEVRLPYLDARLLNFACKLPVSLKMPALREKYILKEVAKSWLPHTIVSRRKFPYRAPDASYLIGSTPGPHTDYLYELLAPDRLAADGLFDPQAVQRLLMKVRNRTVVSHRDNMALIGVLSTQCLTDKFIRTSPGRG